MVWDRLDESLLVGDVTRAWMILRLPFLMLVDLLVVLFLLGVWFWGEVECTVSYDYVRWAEIS